MRMPPMNCVPEVELRALRELSGSPHQRIARWELRCAHFTNCNGSTTNDGNKSVSMPEVEVRALRKLSYALQTEVRVFRELSCTPHQ